MWVLFNANINMLGGLLSAVSILIDNSYHV